LYNILFSTTIEKYSVGYLFACLS